MLRRRRPGASSQEFADHSSRVMQWNREFGAGSRAAERREGYAADLTPDGAGKGDTRPEPLRPVFVDLHSGCCGKPLNGR